MQTDGSSAARSPSEEGVGGVRQRRRCAPKDDNPAPVPPFNPSPAAKYDNILDGFDRFTFDTAVVAVAMPPLSTEEVLEPATFFCTLVRTDVMMHNRAAEVSLTAVRG